MDSPVSEEFLDGETNDPLMCLKEVDLYGRWEVTVLVTDTEVVYSMFLLSLEDIHIV